MVSTVKHDTESIGESKNQNRELCIRLFVEIESKREQYYRYALQLMGNKEDAEDLVQELIAEILRFGVSNEVENAKAYFRGVMRNLSNDMKSAKKSALSLDELRESDIPRTQLFDDFKDVEIREYINALFEKYPQEMKKAFITHYAHGYKIEEVAKMLNITPNALALRFKRMRTSMAKNTLMFILMLSITRK